MKRFADIFRSLRGYASRVKSRLRTQRDRWLHPRRHRRVKRMLRENHRPRRIMVICYGNICRSPYLAAVLEQSLPDVHVTSAGLVGPGRGVPEFGLVAASRHGLDLSAHRSQLLMSDMLRGVDLAVVMDGRQAHYLRAALRVPRNRIVIAGDLDPQTADSRAIRDPWRQPLEVFEASYARLDRCAATLTNSLPATE